MLRFKPVEKELAWRDSSPFEDAWHGIHNPFVCHFGTSQKQNTGTTTQTTAPWSAQQPYLQSGFDAAGNLLNQPAPTQQNPVAPLNGTENTALNGIAQIAANGTPITSAATNFATNLENGQYLNANPANGYFSSLAGTNLGLNGPGSAALAAAANGTGAGSDTLKKYADGSYFSNGYSDDTAQNVMSQVVPQISAIFNRGNAINNPAAARAAAAGVTSALAPLEYQNYQTQEQLQQGAAGTLAANQLVGATGANSSAIAGGNLQATGASGLSGNFQDTLAKMVQGNALAPQNQALSYADMEKMFGVGQTQQTQAQNEASGQAATANFAQMSPYQQLQAYMQAVNGNYGGTTSGSSSTPYYQNNTANTLGSLTSGASLLGSLGGLGTASIAPEVAGGIAIDGLAGTGILGALTSALPFLSFL